MIDRNRKIISGPARLASLNRLIRLSSQKVAFPFYHTVSGQPLPHISNLYTLRTEREFEKDLDEMLLYFEPISFADYLEGSGLHAGKQYMVLSFDDGLVECRDFIAPLLKKKGVPAAFFLNNHFIDNRDLFYRYKASLLIEKMKSDTKVMEAMAGYLDIPEKRAVESILLIGQDQVSLLDALMKETGIDVTGYMKERPVYMNTKQVMDLVDWGFEIGGHSPDHADFSKLDQKEIVKQVRSSVEDLQARFQLSTRYFSFPFTSAGIPMEVIHSLLDKGVAEVLMGTAGLKKTDKTGFIQRIPMEEYECPAREALKTEYLYYLLKGLIGRNKIT
ncbi:MAG: polysaccharide deacetylase family protein [Bacteroidota bacterium]